MTEACKVLKLDYTKIQFKYEGIGNRFQTSMNSCETDGQTFYINEDWADEVEKNNDVYDFQFLMYHEARHIYQKDEIQRFLMHETTKESPLVILSWKADNNHYIRNEGTPQSEFQNKQQSIEIDADAFAFALMLRKGIKQLRIYEPLENQILSRIEEIYKNIWGDSITLRER